MSDFVEYSRGLMDASKGLRNHALALPDGETKQTFLRAALLHACSFLEAHLNYMAEHFQDNSMFTIHEKGILLEKEVAFEHGSFTLSGKAKFSRITDRIELLLAKCSADSTAAKSGWYPELRLALQSRNSLVHPKEAHTLTDDDVKHALSAILTAADTLYKAVFKKGLPYAKKGIEGGLELDSSD